MQTDDEVEEVAGVLIEVCMCNLLGLLYMKVSEPEPAKPKEKWLAKDHKARISDFKRAHCPAEPKNLEQQTQIVLYIGEEAEGHAQEKG